MPTLLELQHAFRTAMLTGSEAVVAAEIVGDGIAPGARLNVYRNNIRGNLTGALKLTFPAVERLVGAEFFAATAACFLAAAPPAQANLYDWGEAFPDFLQSFPPAASLPYLPDVARLEWAIGRALHAPMLPPLDLDAFGRLSADEQAEIRFRRHPSVSLLRLAYPAHRIWKAVLEEDRQALACIDPAGGGECLVVHRAASGADVLPLSPAGLCFATALCDGTSLSDALALVAPHTAAGLLGAFLARGLFCAVLPASSAPDPQTATAAEEHSRP